MLIVGSVYFHDYRYDHGNRNVVIFASDKSSFDALPNRSMVEVGFGLHRGTRWGQLEQIAARPLLKERRIAR